MKDRKDKSAAPEPAEPNPDAPNRAITAADISYSERLAKVLEYRELGATIRQISERMETAGFKGCSKSNINRMLVKALEEQIKADKMKVRHYLRLELNKIERAELAIFPVLLKLAHKIDVAEDATESQCRALEKLSATLDRAWKRRDSLLGLNKPIKHEHTGEDGKPIETSTVTRIIMPTGVDEPIREE